jgi:hypothetical protein
VVINTDGTLLTYTPNSSFTGNDSFSYTISDDRDRTSTADVTITVSPGPQTLYAVGESGTMADVVGSYQDTWQRGGAAEMLTEVSQRKKKVLEHIWVFNLAGGDDITFSLEAWRSGTEDAFTFQYSTDGATWIDMFDVVATEGNHAVQDYSLPAGLTGELYIRAIDTNRSPKEVQYDTLYVDMMSITAVGGQVQLPTVTVEATDANAAEQGPDTGTFTITRNDTSGSLAVHYELTGTASEADYSAEPLGTVTFAQGEASRTITVTPVDDTNQDPGETVTLTISPDPAYDIGAADSATLTIADNDGSTSFVDDIPILEHTVRGTVVSGALGQGQVLAEELDRKKTYLEHTWEFDVTGGSTVTFNVEAWHDGTEDDFLFQYSLDGVNWANMLTITKTSDDNTLQTYALPSDLAGAVWIRVLDTNHAANKKDIDRLYIDQLFIRSE